MKILIVEDELVLAYAMEEMLKTLGYENVIIEPGFGEAEEILNSNSIDLAILDINLGKGEEGIALAETCNAKKIPFLFTTSYTDKATVDTAIKTNPGAYLIKPVTESNLYTTIQILLNQLVLKPSTLIEFKDGTELIRIPLDHILYLRSENIYVNVVTPGKTYLYRGSLASFIQKVPPGNLIQTHRAYAINPTHVKKLSSGCAIVDEVEIPISRNFRQQIARG